MTKGKHGLIYLFGMLFFLAAVSSAFSQNFSRTLEVKNPRMSGEDVRRLQNRLLDLKFYQTGDADGVYGPLTSEAVKDIQTFSGFEPNGKVSRELWNFIFNNANSSFLTNVSAVLTYNPMKLEKSWDLLSGDDGEAWVYTSSNGDIKIIEYNRSQAIGYETSMTCYFVTGSYYFVKYTFVFPGRTRRDSIGGVCLVDRGNFYEIYDGTISRTDPVSRPYDGTAITAIVNDILRLYYY